MDLCAQCQEISNVVVYPGKDSFVYTKRWSSVAQEGAKGCFFCNLVYEAFTLDSKFKLVDKRRPANDKRRDGYDCSSLDQIADQFEALYRSNNRRLMMSDFETNCYIRWASGNSLRLCFEHESGRASTIREFCLGREALGKIK